MRFWEGYPFGEHLLNIAVTQSKPGVQLDRIADDIGWEAVTLKGELAHRASLIRHFPDDLQVCRDHTPRTNRRSPSAPNKIECRLRRKSSIGLRIFRNSSFGTATSANWNVTYRSRGSSSSIGAPMGTTRRDKSRPPVARSGKSDRDANTARPRLRIVYRGLRYARLERS